MITQDYIFGIGISIIMAICCFFVMILYCERKTTIWFMVFWVVGSFLPTFIVSILLLDKALK